MERRRSRASKYPLKAENFPLPELSAENVHDTLEGDGFENKSYIRVPHWFSWYDVEGVESAFAVPVDSGRILHLRTVDEAVSLLEERPDDYVLVASETVDLPAALAPYESQVIVACSNGATSPLVMTQEIFLRMLRWENQLNALAASDGPLNALLNIGAIMFDGFLFVAGIDNNVVGFSDEARFPNEEYREMMMSGTLSSSDIFVNELLADDYCALTGYVAQIEDRFGKVCVFSPIRYSDSLFGFLVLVLGERLIITQGLKDQFTHYAYYATSRCRKLLTAGVEKDLPHYYFLTSLLRGDSFSRSSIEQNLQRLGVPLEAHYKVIVLNPRDTCLSVDVLVDAMRLLNDRKCFVVIYEDFVTAILYDEATDGALSHGSTLEEVERYIYTPYSAVCGCSQVFLHISDVRFGFRQAVYSYTCRDVIAVERGMMREEEPPHCITFEMAMPYFLIRENETDRRFHDFCLSHSPLESMLQGDLENDTNNFLMLWLFLLYERNASMVGKRMFMHRNSVLYHIKQIEKRFNFELDNWYNREKLLMDYRALFIRLPKDVLARLFKNN